MDPKSNQEVIEKVNVSGVCLEGDEVTLRFIPLQEAADIDKMEFVPVQGEPLFTYQIMCAEEKNIGKSVQEKEPTTVPKITSGLEDKESSEPIRKKPRNDPTKNDSSMFTCTNQGFGCNATFGSIAEKTDHFDNCIYNVLIQCKNPECVASKSDPYKSLKDLVKHAIEKHNCPSLKKDKRDESSFQLPINLERTFLHPRNGDYSSKIVGTVEHKVNGKDFHVVFFAVADDGDKGDLCIFAVLSGQSDSVSNYVRIDLALSDSEGKVLCTMTPPRHPSHHQGDKIITCALASGKPVCDAIKSKQLLKFDNHNLPKGDQINLLLTFNCLAYRCNLKVKGGHPTLPYLLTPEELYVAKSVQKKLGWTLETPQFAIPGIILPYLRSDSNMLIQCLDEEQVLNTFMAVSLNKKTRLNKSKDTMGNQVHHPISLILLPAKFMFHAIGSRIQKMANSIGLVCTVLSDAKNDEIVDEMILKGCDIVVTSAPVLNELVKRKVDHLFHVMYKHLKLLLIPNGDYLLKSANSVKELHHYIYNLSQEVHDGLVKVALSPLATKELQNTYMDNLFIGNDFVVALMGPKHNSLIAPLSIFELDERDCESKTDKVIQILRVYDKNKKWLIIAEESYAHYRKDFQYLTGKLQKSFPEKANLILQCDENSRIQESCFLPIKETEGIIVLSSYYSLQYELVKMVDGVIVFSLPSKFPDLIRIVPIGQALEKPIFSLEYDEDSSSDRVVKRFKI